MSSVSPKASLAEFSLLGVFVSDMAGELGVADHLEEEANCED